MGNAMRSIFFIILYMSLCMVSLAPPVAGEDLRLTVKQSDQSIQESTFREHFKEYICRQLRKRKADVVVYRFKVKGNRPVPAGKISFKLFQKNRIRLKRQVKIITSVMVNGHIENEVMLSGYIAVSESVVCASRDLKRGEVIKKDDVYLGKIKGSRLSLKVLTHMDKVAGLRAKHNIKAGTCLKEWMLEKSPVVEKGDLITIFAESGNLKVTAQGRVLMKGCTGEIIKVQNLMSKKDIYATVVDKSTVMVEF
jgi:flagella basal body P-ring formation protein FlgA